MIYMIINSKPIEVVIREEFKKRAEQSDMIRK